MDNISLLKGSPLQITNNVSIKHLTLGNIADVGYENYMEYLTTLISSSLDIADILLYEMEIWYEDIKDEWIFFLQKCINEKELINILVKDEDGNIVGIEQNCVTIKKEYQDAINFFFDLDGQYIVIEKDNQLIINNVNKDEYGNSFITPSSFRFTKYIYEITTQFLKDIHWIKDDYDFVHGGTKRAKKYLLLQTYKDRKKTYKKKSTITLDSIVSALISSGHNAKDIWDYPIYLIYDQYYRTIQINEYKNTITALYNGCIDTKKNPINWEKINWSAVIKSD